MIKKKIRKSKTERAMNASWKEESMKKELKLAMIGLIINASVLPGLGTLIMGKTKEGILQMVLFILGNILFLVVFIMSNSKIPENTGLYVVLVIWTWGIATGIKAIKVIKEIEKRHS